MYFRKFFLKLTFIAAVLVLATPVYSQWHPDSVPEYFKKRYLSEEEMNTPLRNIDFTETPPPTGIARMVGEYEPMQAVLIRYPLGIPYSLIREMAKDIEVITLVSSNSQANTVLNLYTNNNINTDNCSFIVAPTDSYWTRDYGPWFIFDGNDEPGIVDFPYNRPRPNDNNVIPVIADQMGVNLFGMNVMHTGGNMMADGYTYGASTDLVYDENNLTPQQVAEKFEDYLGITRYDVTIDPQGEYIKHIDCWGKYLAPDKILIGEVPPSNPQYNDYESVAEYFANTPCAYGYPYKVYRVFMPGTYPPTPYSNSLILNDKVFVPISGSQHDNAALEVYQEAMPGYEIVGIHFNDWLNTDALHCRTHEIADIAMLYVNHMPTYGTQAWSDSLSIETGIKAYSGASLIADSLNLFYSINGGPYLSKPLIVNETNNWQAWIGGYDSFDTIRYYLAAADESGRSIKHPFMGAHDPHMFVMEEKIVNELTIHPDTLVFMELVEASFYISNHSSVEAQINQIESSNPELVQMNLVPELPYTLAVGDSLEVVVEIIEPDYSLFNEGFVEEEITINSSFGTYTVHVEILDDLINSTLELAGKSDLKLIPNPFSEELIIAVPAAYGTASIRIVDLNGNAVYSFVSAHQDGTSLQFEWKAARNDGSALPKGMYVLHYRDARQTISKKLIHH